MMSFGEDSLVCERWAYDDETNDCLFVNRNLEPVFEAEYDKNHL